MSVETLIFCHFLPHLISSCCLSAHPKVLGSIRSAAIMDSDSSDDDILLKQATFTKRPNRRESNKMLKMENTLDRVLKESKARHESSLRIQRIRLENADDMNSDDDELLHARVEKIQESSHRPRVLEHSFDDAFSAEKSKELKASMDSDLICRLGVRQGIVKFDSTRCKAGAFFHSQDEAVESLCSALRGIETLSSFYESFMSAADFGMLPEFLESPKLADLKGHGVDCDDKSIQLVFEWLVTVAISADLAGADLERLANSATQTLLLSRARGSFSKTISVRDYDDMLTCWVPLENNAMQGTDVVEQDAENFGGLLNFLLLWESNVSLSPDDDSDTSASNCLARLIRLGLDVSLETQLIDVQQRSVVRIAEVAACHKTGSCELSSWAIQAAKVTLKGLKDMGPGPADAEDADDVQACLCVSAVVRLVPMGTTMHESAKAILYYQLELALQALSSLLGDNEDSRPSPLVEPFLDIVVKDSNHTALANLADSSRSWLAIVAAYAGLMHIAARDDSDKNPTMFLARLECLVVCYEAGLRMLRHDIADTEKEGAEYGCLENARSYRLFLEKFDELVVLICARTSKRIASSSIFRRAHTVLLHLHMYHSVVRERVKYLAGSNVPGTAVQQAKISSFFKAKPVIAPDIQA
jgi:hypothetical protein